ncbi:hypothetical protein J6590_070207 [Homalodisca vitripennis]|nr:hypothetical protein J6590_070207 [Homalodisca vitripennis]
MKTDNLSDTNISSQIMDPCTQTEISESYPLTAGITSISARRRDGGFPVGAFLRKPEETIKEFFNNDIKFYINREDPQTPFNRADNGLTRAPRTSLNNGAEHGQSPEEIKNTRLVNYSLMVAYGRECNIKGGVTIYKIDSLQNETVNLEIENTSIILICEIAVVRISLSNKRSLNLVGVYRPPSNRAGATKQALSVIEKTLGSATAGGISTVLIGDININDFETSTNKIMFDELLTSFDIRSVHLPSTRIAVTVRNQSTSSSYPVRRITATSIDAVCTNLRSYETDVQIINTGISDHTTQFCRLTLPVSCANSISSTRRHLNDNNLLQLKQLLSDQSLHDVLSINDDEEAYNLFTYSVSLVLDSIGPRKKTRRYIKSRKIIYDSDASELKEEYLRAHNLYLLTNDVRDKQSANNFKKLYDLKLRDLRRDHSSEHILSSDNKSKSVWDVITANVKRRKKVLRHALPYQWSKGRRPNESS